MTNILVIAEHDNKDIKASTFSTLAAAIDVANKLDQDCNIDMLIVGHSSDAFNSMLPLLNKHDVINKVFIANHQIFEHQLAEGVGQLVANLAKDHQYVLFPATTYGKNIAPRVAARLDVNPLTDVIEIIDHETFLKPIYAGNAIAKIKLNDDIKLMSVRPTCFDLDSADKEKIKNTSCEIQPLDAIDSSEKSRSRFVSFSGSNNERPDLVSANVVVSGGRALQSSDNFKLIYDLADSLQAAVGASRAAVDAGYVPNDYQVGQTGKVVAPSLYIAVGISGAIQHVAGMQESKIIVAINKDSEAPIFNIADYGLVGDLFTILPELTDKIRKLKQ